MTRRDLLGGRPGHTVGDTVSDSVGGSLGQSLGRTVQRSVSGLRWYVRAVLGADAYERYLAHQGRHHPGEPVLAERAFWRHRQDEQSVDPGSRCC